MVKAEELEQLIAETSAGSAGEVVTRALSRDIKLPHSIRDCGVDHFRQRA